jgi:ABC-2 type transport system permease protein
MSELLLVIRREFRERVSSKSFLLGTIALPLFLGAVLILPVVFDSAGGERRLAVVDQAPAGIGERVIAALEAMAAADGEARYRLERVSAPLEEARDALHARIAERELDGYLVLPPDILEGNRAQYRGTAVPGPALLRDLGLAVSQAVQAERLRASGLELEEVAHLLRRVEIQPGRITAAGEDGHAVSAFILAYIVAFLVYFMTAFYGMNVLRSVLEEKTNRISEILVSSMRAMHLLAGKVLGVGGAALLQVAIWAVSFVILLRVSGPLAERFGLPVEVIRGMSVEPLLGAALLGFFVLGFLVYASLFAALGAAVTSEQEAQSLQIAVMVPLIVPLLFMMPLTTDPLGPAATVLGLVPFTSPVAMPMRMAAGPVPGAQVLLALAVLALALAAAAWVSGKIYRIGILSTGKKPTLRELARWLRTA